MVELLKDIKFAKEEKINEEEFEIVDNPIEYN